MRGPDKYALMSDLGRPGRRFTQGGPFSLDILCAKHENITGDLDRKAVDFCRYVAGLGDLEVWTIKVVTGVDADEIVKFALSVLWRCHQSERDEARQVNLGPYASLIEQVVFNGTNSASFHTYTYAAVSRQIDTRELASMPIDARVNGQRRWSFSVGGVTFVTDLGFPKPSTPQLMLNGAPDIKVLIVDFDNTPLRSAWEKLVNR
jgi:hypothetical protein